MTSAPPVQSGHPTQKKKGKTMARLVLLIMLGAGTWGTLFMTGVVTLGGVPYSVVRRVWQTPIARQALLQRNSVELHDIMDSMGIEEEIKLYHSKHIKDPVELDQHIHQILYNWTRYVGANYVVVRGKLIPKTYDMVEEVYECPEC
ncbi:hypothetical protein IQ260_26000 [Leptolyngbya cf. ectocarpi LEGE 11479]|uniref:Uncharacterized protein n=1 Tax=Leptolyngbya cf. ectocarpi LEGE 11479 TaxID=1828722 RepID=A0A928ZZ00_LEPEC|nr:hypothetical protein [Leptolyngbya ectocarpi]MBE9070099.1 hypothetical protein [Leptolyngbya cf. ectocarpi LEGE 11479]